MKNVIFIVIDSVIYDEIGKKYGSSSTTPFIDKISKKCLKFTNIFSQGPYTEAGTKALLCGVDCLNDKGYLYRFDKSKYYITDIFKDQGFVTNALMYPTTVYSAKTLKNIDNMYYTSGYLFKVLWEQKVLYYIELYKKNRFGYKELEDLIELFDLIFESWEEFFKIDDYSKYILIEDLIKDYDFNLNYKLFEKEKKLYNADKKKYLMDILKTERSNLLEIDSVNFNNLIKHKIVNEVLSENVEFKKLFRKIQRRNIKNNKLPKNLGKSILKRVKNKHINKYLLGEILFKIRAINAWKDLEVIKKEEKYKEIVSSNRQFNLIHKILIEQPEHPNFILSHIEEPHYFNTFFSYDSNDKSIIDKEFKYAFDYISSINEKEFKGSLSYQLSLRYIDMQLEQLFNNLEKSDLLKKSIVVITADHGSSYNFYPLRNRTVINFHKENYNIPFMIYSDDITDDKEFNEFGSSKDIIPTVLDYLGLTIPEDLTGQSMLLENYKKNHTIIEFMGPGCPDMRNREAWLAIRDKEYLVTYKGFLNQKFNEKNICEIYNLVEDPSEQNNISSLRNEKIYSLIKKLEKRFYSIYENNYEWIKKD